MHRFTKLKLFSFFMACLIGLTCLGFPPVRQLAAAAGGMSQEDRDAIDRATRQMEDIAKQSDELAKEQQRIASQQKTVLGEMKVLSNQIGELEKEIQNLDGQISEKEAQIEILIGDIEVKTEEVHQRNQYFDKRLNQIYRDGDMSVLDVLFESASLTDFLTRYDLMQRIIENDADLLKGLREAKADLEAQKAALEEIRTGLEEEKAVRQDKSGELNRQWSAQNRMSRELEADLALAREAEDELNALSKQIEKFVADIQAKYREAYMGSGTMAWPVPGWTRISSDYGYRIHPIYKVNRFHSGIDIPANAGTKVVAAEAGRVIMATTYGGFGKTVILDHGGGVASQYSHLSSISVSQGDKVYKGDKVGGVGTTGLSTGNHLHFQIMVNGATVDPQRNGKYFVNPR
ncbi:MAG: peptidoglycan DD-metalloendopeptidase family protein [Clostridiales bacterium]|nr:peptidoglycan DD-metalloendopeptidase family protein [Clostridiales bacterium]